MLESYFGWNSVGFKSKWRSNALCEEDHIHQGSVETTRNTSCREMLSPIILAAQSMTERVLSPVAPLGSGGASCAICGVPSPSKQRTVKMCLPLCKGQS